MMTQEWSTDDYRAVVQTARDASGLTFCDTRRSEAEHRIRAAMRLAGLTDIGLYRQLVQHDPAALDELVSALAVGETYFFRDPHHFEFVRRVVLPGIRACRGAEHIVRAWSAGCSSGEEAYSLAILFEEEGLAHRSQIMATDISRPALRQARAARYRAWSMRGVDATTRERYFTYISGGAAGVLADEYVLAERLRDRVHCAVLNLTRDPEPSLQAGIDRSDIIFCRNVLIYFEPETIAPVLRRLASALADGGWLILGPSDPVVPGALGLQTRRTDAALFYQRTGALELPGRACAPAVRPRAPRPPSTRRPPPRSSAAKVPPPSLDRGPLAAAEAALLAGDYHRAVALAGALPDESAACALQARALANLDLAAAERLCAAAAARHATAAELHHLHAALCLGLARYADAARAAERVVYLDPTLAAGHFMLASIRRHRGERAAARRSYRNAQALCAALPRDQIVPLCDGGSADQMAAVAASELRQLEAAGEGDR